MADCDPVAWQGREARRIDDNNIELGSGRILSNPSSIYEFESLGATFSLRDNDRMNKGRSVIHVHNAYDGYGAYTINTSSDGAISVSDDLLSIFLPNGKVEFERPVSAIIEVNGLVVVCNRDGRFNGEPSALTGVDFSGSLLWRTEPIYTTLGYQLRLGTSCEAHTHGSVDTLDITTGAVLTSRQALMLD